MHRLDKLLVPDEIGVAHAVLERDVAALGPTAAMADGYGRADYGAARRFRCNPVAVGIALGGADALVVMMAGLLCGYALLDIGTQWDRSVAVAAGFVGLCSAAALALRGRYGASALLEQKVALDALAFGLLQAFGALLLVHAAGLAARDMGLVGGLVADGAWGAHTEAWLLAFGVASMIGLIGLRLAWLRLGPYFLSPDRLVVVGANELSKDFLQRMRSLRTHDLRGVVCDHGESAGATFCGLPVLGTVASLLPMIRRDEVDAVIIAIPWSTAQRIPLLISEIAAAPVDLFVAPHLPSGILPGRPVTRLASLPLLRASDRPLSAGQALLKRAEDLFLAGILIVLLAPVMIGLALLIKATSPGPVFFRQRRLGFNNRVIEVLKFRTMYTHLADSDARQQTSRNDKRVTPLGGLLRRASLDELPQLLNVLRGEMSLVGPRPHGLQTTAGGVPLEEAVPQYASRHRVKPGITGWAQVHGLRGELDTVDKIVNRVAYDLDYIRNWSLGLDLKIIWRTTLLILIDPHAY